MFKLRLALLAGLAVIFGTVSTTAIIAISVSQHRAKQITVLENQINQLTEQTNALEHSLTQYLNQKEIVNDATQNFKDSFTDATWLSQPCTSAFNQLYNNAVKQIFYNTCNTD